MTTGPEIVSEVFAEILTPENIEAHVRYAAEHFGVDPEACLARLPGRNPQ